MGQSLTMISVKISTAATIDTNNINTTNNHNVWCQEQTTLCQKGKNRDLVINDEININSSCFGRHVVNQDSHSLEGQKKVGFEKKRY